MNRISFLTNIANEMHIIKGNNESDISWKCRVVYSAIAKMALAALYDINEDEESSVSITYLKKRIEDLQNSYTELFPEINGYLPSLKEDFYELFLYNGYIYHSPNWIYPSKKKIISGNNVSFVRGDCFDSNIRLSGIGTYLFNSKTILNNNYGIFENFLFTRNYKEYINNLINDAKWEIIEFKEDIEFLRLNGSFNKGYWKNSPDKNIISLLRTSNYFNKQYYLYKYENENRYVFSLPEWAVENREYLRIACGLLIKYNKWQGFNVKRDGDIVHIKLNYLLPPSEMNFFKLYTWPIFNNNLQEKQDNDLLYEKVSHLLKSINDFEGIMQKDVFSEFCNILKISGLYKE